MRNLHTLKLNASSIGSAAPAQSRTTTPTEPPVEPAFAPAPAPPAAPRHRATATRKQLVALFAIAFAATLAAVAATGSVHNTIFRVASAGIALTVALVIAIEAAASARRQTATAPAATVPVASAKKPLTKAKIALLLIMTAGFATYFGNGGTFSSFSADTTNASSNIASGTLTMSNTVNSQATACFSYNGAANVNSGCSALFSLTGAAPQSAAGNLPPGSYGSVASVKVENTGSIDATKLQVYAPTTTDCVDAKATSNQVSGATVGNTLTFNSGSLCGSAIMYLQEVGTGHHYCWSGVGVGTSRCAAPFSMPYNGTAIVGTTITWTGTPNGNITSGDTIQVSQLNASTQTYNVVQCPATGTVWMGDATTTVSVGACTTVSGSNSGFNSTAIVTDYTTTNTTLSGTFAANTISSFDTAHGGLSQALTLYPTTGDGTINNTGFGLALPKYDSTSHTSARTFYVGVYLPTPTSTNQNTLQGLMSTFGLTWHIEQ
jgi:hypothetical protein